MTPPNVLIIEDDIVLLRQIATAFTAAGYVVRGAADGEIGLATFAQAPADLVVTDLIMPTREGIETIIALRAGYTAVKIIAISGGMKIGASSLLGLASQLGADAVLAKPFRHAELIELANSVLAPPQAAAA